MKKYSFQIHIQPPETFDTAKERMDTFIDIWFAPEYRQCVRELYDANGHTEAVQAMIDDPEMRADDDELLSVVFTEREDQPGHTPGPWSVGTDPQYRRGFLVRDDNGDGYVVAACDYVANTGAKHINDRLAANARLIAAAPDMFAMLSRLLDGILRLPELPATISLLDIEQSRAAISKATKTPQ